MVEDERLADGDAPDDETVVVPMRLYKTVTVFSTLVATVLVVFGFFFFDAATHTSNPIRETIVWVIELSGWTPPADAVGIGFGLLGVGAILLGAGSYILGTRFKTEEMVGKDEDVADDDHPDGESDDDQRDAESGEEQPDVGSSEILSDGETDSDQPVADDAS